MSSLDRPRSAPNATRRLGAREPGPPTTTRRGRRGVASDAEEASDPEARRGRRAVASDPEDDAVVPEAGRGRRAAVSTAQDAVGLGKASGLADGSGSGAAGSVDLEGPRRRPAASGVPAEPGRGSPRRALVLGGGGVLGFAWMVGALSALEVEARFDARDVEIIVGTSAGAVAAAALSCGVTVDQMRRHHQGFPSLDDPPIAFEYDTTGHGLPPRPGFGFGSPRLLLGAIRHPAGTRTLLALTGALPTGRGTLQPVADMVRGIATESGLDGDWPARPHPWIVAVDYWSGRRVVFGRDDVGLLAGTDVSLADAVVASCSIPGWYPPMQIGARPYIDGGAASNASADVVRDELVDEVYVLAPMASIHLDRPRSPVARVERSIRRAITRGLLADIAELRAAGKRVIFVCPGADDLAVIGANLMNPRRRTDVLDMAMRTSAIELRTQLAVHAHPHVPIRSVSVAE